jgi:predicted thioesterase
MLEVGLKGHQESKVTQEYTAKAMGSGSLEVYATPAMIALMEETAFVSVQEHLEDGCGTVGTKVDIEHVAASPLGMKITCDSVLREIDGRRLVFDLEVIDEKGLIGKGTHERFIIDNEKFQKKTNQKAD